MKYITVIPARGGSKRFPHKNIFPLSGFPLIGYSIKYSLSNPNISETYVSTDSQEIMEVSMAHGAKVLKRPDELSGDFVTTAAVLKYVGETLAANGEDFDFMVLLQATNPLRPKGLLSEAIHIMEKGGYDSLMTMSKSLKKLGKIIDNQFIPWNYRFGMRSQDMDPLYYENGLLYITSREQISKGHIIGDKMYPMVVDHIFGEVDIDTREDMSYAEYVFLNTKTNE